MMVFVNESEPNRARLDFAPYLMLNNSVAGGGGGGLESLGKNVEKCTNRRTVLPINPLFSG